MNDDPERGENKRPADEGDEDRWVGLLCQAAAEGDLDKVRAHLFAAFRLGHDPASLYERARAAYPRLPELAALVVAEPTARDQDPCSQPASATLQEIHPVGVDAGTRTASTVVAEDPPVNACVGELPDDDSASTGSHSPIVASPVATSSTNLVQRVACVACGHGNSRSRRSCKRCRADLANAPLVAWLVTPEPRRGRWGWPWLPALIVALLFNVLVSPGTADYYLTSPRRIDPQVPLAMLIEFGTPFVVYWAVASVLLMPFMLRRRPGAVGAWQRAAVAGGAVLMTCMAMIAWTEPYWRRAG